MTIPSFHGATISSEPFPAMRMPRFLPDGLSDATLEWLETSAPWRLRTESFYEQYEFSLLGMTLPDHLAALTQDTFLGALESSLCRGFDIDGLVLVDVTAHLLDPGKTIRIHNDYLGGEETHRLLIQFNSGWTEDMGGLLMLFSGDGPEHLADVLLPEHGSAFAFEISPSSFHAVSTVRAGRRFTIVYTFRQTP